MFFPRSSINYVNHVKDLLDENSKFFTYAAFTAKYDLSCSFLEFDGFISAIRSIKDTSESIATKKKGYCF